MPLKAGSAFIDVLANLTPLKAQMASQIPNEFRAAGAKSGALFQGGLKGALGNLKGAFPKGGLGALVGASAVAGVAAGIKQVADETAAYAETVEDLSEVTGAQAEDASELAAVMKALGIDVDSSARPLLNLSRVLESGGQGLSRFFDAREISELRAGTLSDAIDTLADRFKNLEGQQQENALLVAAFGTRGAVAMRELLEATDEEREAIVKLAESQGLIFTQEQLDAAREYRIEMNKLNTSWEGLKVTVGNAAIPVLTDAADVFNDVADATGGAGGFLESFLRQLPFLREVSGISLFKDLFGEGEEAAEGFEETLGRIEEAGFEGEDAAKALERAFTQAFEIADAAAEGFEKRLDALVPDLGEALSGLDTPSDIAEAVEQAADRVASAEERLADARERLTDNERHLTRTPALDRERAKAVREIEKAERELAEARDEAAEAAKGRDRADEVPTVPELGEILRQNTQELAAFVGGLDTLRARFAEIAGDEEIEEAFLAHLAELGPAAAPLLRDLVSLTDQELAGMAGVFGDQIAAAKAAADIQFDKFPANFTEKLSAARGAAANELEALIGQFEALPAGVDTTLWDAKMRDLALAIQAMSDTGQVALTPIEESFLNSALSAETAEERVASLQRLLDSLNGKTIDILFNLKADTSDVLGGSELRAKGGEIPIKHWGGSVEAGNPYRVLPNEEVFVPDADGRIERVTNHSKTSNTHIENVNVRANTWQEIKAAIDRERRLASLAGG